MSINPQNSNSNSQSLSQNFINKISHNPNIKEILENIENHKKINNIEVKEIKKFNFETKNDFEIFPCISNTHCVSLLKNSPTRGEHVQELKKIFIDKTNTSLENSENFLSNKSWVNEKQWVMGKIKRNLKNEWLDKYSKTIQIWKEIEFLTKNEGLVPIFFTGTVVGELHPFSSKSQNRKNDWSLKKLNESYKELQDLHTQIRKQSNRTLGYSPHFIKAIEYHKSYVPHTHIVYFVNPNDVDNFLKIIENKENLNKNIGRTETKIIDAYNPKSGKSPVSYLLKYLKKNIVEITQNEEDDSNLKIFNGWKNTLKIKQLYNNSIYKIPKWAFKKVSWYFKNFEELGYRSMLEAIENEVEIVSESIQLDNTIKTKIINKVENPKYKIYRKTERYEYWSDEKEEKLVGDKILEFTIEKDNEILFDKNDFVFLEDMELIKYKEDINKKLYDFQLKLFLNYEDFIEFIKYDNIDFVNNVFYKNDIRINEMYFKYEYDIF